MHWLRLVSRDMMALKMGAQDGQLQVPMYKTQLLRLLPRWSMQALAKVITETLQAERALRLHIKPPRGGRSLYRPFMMLGRRTKC